MIRTKGHTGIGEKEGATPPKLAFRDPDVRVRLHAQSGPRFAPGYILPFGKDSRISVAMRHRYRLGNSVVGLVRDSLERSEDSPVYDRLRCIETYGVESPVRQVIRQHSVQSNIDGSHHRLTRPRQPYDAESKA